MATHANREITERSCRPHAKILCGLAGIVILGLVVPLPVSAHTFEENNGISGILHIAPDDLPKAGQPTQIHEFFNDPKDTFSIDGCTCHVLVKRDNQILQTTPLTRASPDATVEGTAVINFPKTGDYHVLVAGIAKQSNFPSFQLDYVVHVSSSAHTSVLDRLKNSMAVLEAAIAMLILLVALTYTLVKGARHD